MSAVADTLANIRERGAAHFAAHGLPNRRVEAWKYTPVQHLSTGNHSLTGTALPAIEGADAVDGLTVLDLESALSGDDGTLRALLSSLDHQGAEHAFNAINDAALDNGLVIVVKRGVKAGQIRLTWPVDGGINGDQAPAVQNSRVCLLLGEEAELELVESYGGDDAAKALSVVLQVDLSRHATLRHARVQTSAKGHTLITRTVVAQAEGSHYAYTGLDLGEGLARHDLQTRLNGAGAHCDLDGAYLPTDQGHVDNHLDVEHRAPQCSSSQYFRGVMRDRSRAVFNGRVHVLPGADGTEARQSNANLLLSELAEVNTKPELVIEADEVVASHGATVGQLDESAVFYLRSRGLDEASARQLLTSAFCRSVIDRLPEGDVREFMGAALSGRLGPAS